MSGIFLTHLLMTLGMIAATWAVYARFTSPRFRRWLFCRKKTGAAQQETSTFSPVVLMRWLLVTVFIAIAVLFGYVALLDAGRNDGFTAVFAGLICAGGVLSFGLPLHEIWDYFGLVGLEMLPLDRAWVALLAGLSPMLTLFTAATMFRLPKFWGVLFFQRKRSIYIFSDLNERAQKYANALTASLPEHDRHEKGRADDDGLGRRKSAPYIVFCSDGQVDPVDTANIVGYSLVLKQNICNLHLPAHALKRISFCLITDNDNLLIEQTIRLQEKYKHSGCRIRCVTSSSLNEHVIDQINKETNNEAGTPGCNAAAPGDDIAIDPSGRIEKTDRAFAEAVQTSFIDVINEPIRVVYHGLNLNGTPLLNQEFLQKVVPEKTEGSFTLNALVLGIGALGEELARTLLWYCQLPDIHVQLTIADRESEAVIRERIYRKNPYFEEELRAIGYGDVTGLQIRPNVDLLSGTLEKLLAEKECHFVFIATGEDSRNYDLALRVRRYYLHHPMPWGCPDVRAVIWDDTVTDIIREKPIQALKGVEGAGDPRMYTDYTLLLGRDQVSAPAISSLYHPACGVSLMGAMVETLGDMQSMETEALRYHAHYGGESSIGDQISISRKTYREYYASTESDKRSNWAVAIHGRVKAEWYRWKNPGDKEAEARALAALAENEHVRWCIFKLLEGDVPVPAESLDAYLEKNEKGRDEDTIRGFHATLRSWENLRKQHEQAKAAGRVRPQFGQKEADFWAKRILSNTELVKFSLAINRKEA